jgi:hypothetical protein
VPCFTLMFYPFGSVRRGLGIAAVLSLLTALAIGAEEPKSERLFLSGHGPKDAVAWDFTVTAGRRAGEKTTIPVPSNWELQGFGTYNYGQEKTKSDEHGLYRKQFTVPAEWKERRIWLVFDGVMTDATVAVNGRPVGPVHQGGFYRFRYDVTSLVKLGTENANVLEVDVAKVSANAETERAERGGDYWVFGGLYRPVWLEAVPAEAIDHVAIDAQADGSLTANVVLGHVASMARADGLTLAPERIEAQVLAADGKSVGSVTTPIMLGGEGRVRVALKIEKPQTWTAETPALYTLKLALKRGGETLHVATQRFGFRTFEVRAGQGLFLNGKRVLLKGVDRHSFRPETGRALNAEDCYADARLIRQMNMNAVRMSHYPPDEAFLDACDELGIYVLDELSGWHAAHGTTVGRQLVREMVERDVNHPGILFWDNGNEGGWNRDLDGEFALHDPQHRRVLHPWDTFSGIDAKHYVAYDDFVKRLHGSNIVLPTEILHALYDGGAGAGLDDYWRVLSASPVGGGMFIWDFADEGVVRTDQGGRVDVFGTYAPDGIVGPHFEKEGSFYTVRDVWSPVQIEAPRSDETFDGTLTVHNGYDFTSLNGRAFTWKLVNFDERRSVGKAAEWVLAQDTIFAPDVAPHADGKLAIALPPEWRDADALTMTALDADGGELSTWTWVMPGLAKRMARAIEPAKTGQDATLEKAGAVVRLRTGETVASFDAATGTLRELQHGEKIFGLSNGPRLAYARPPGKTAIEWLPLEKTEGSSDVHRVTKPGLASTVEVEIEGMRTVAFAGFKLEISADGETWKTIFDASRRANDGLRYEFPPQKVAAVRVSKIRNEAGQPMTLKTLRVGYAADRFPKLVGEPANVTTGADPATGAAWIEAKGAGMERVRWTMRDDGTLRLDYAYALEGECAYHGVTFDYPEEQIASFRWLGEGPYRVWQNRLRGTLLGVHEHVRHELQPGENWDYPEFEGHFAGMRWARFATPAGALSVTSASPEIYLRVGTPRITHSTTTVDFPAGEISFLQAIPAIGSKGKPAEQAGPTSQWATAHGRYEGTVVFGFADDETKKPETVGNQQSARQVELPTPELMGEPQRHRDYRGGRVNSSFECAARKAGTDRFQCVADDRKSTVPAGLRKERRRKIDREAKGGV